MVNKKRKVEDAELGDAGGVEQQHELDAEVMKLLEPLDMDSMRSILQQACVQHPDVLHEVRKHVDKYPAHRKLFVRGLGWDTTSETLRDVFCQYGELEEGAVIRDRHTYKSRGFGFVTFRHMDGALRALKEPSKRIDGRMTVCQFAAWASSSSQPVEDVAFRKIYIGNVPVGISADKVLCVFSQFGEIAEGPLGFDKATGASKGFALIIYKTSEGAKNALVEPYKSIEGHQVHCKLAVEGMKHTNNNSTNKQELETLGNRPIMSVIPCSQSPTVPLNYPYLQAPAGSRAYSYGSYPQYYPNGSSPGVALHYNVYAPRL